VDHFPPRLIRINSFGCGSAALSSSVSNKNFWARGSAALSSL
jgi:hypothetical protein